MKALYRLGLTAAVLLAGCGLAQDMPVALLEATSSRLSKLTQLRQEAAQEFRARDRNRDGLLSEREYAQALGLDQNPMDDRRYFEMANFKQARISRLRDDRVDPIEYRDVYVANRLSEARETEIGQSTDAWFEELDQNQDRVMDVQDLASYLLRCQDEPLARRLAKELDKTHNRADGLLDYNEFHNLQIWLTVLRAQPRR